MKFDFDLYIKNIKKNYTDQNQIKPFLRTKNVFNLMLNLQAYR